MAKPRRKKNEVSISITTVIALVTIIAATLLAEIQITVSIIALTSKH